jgi:hypothetical protein
VASAENVPARPDSPVWLAGHECAHCCAAFLLGRKIVSVSIRPDADSHGRAHIQTLKVPQTLEECLEDLIVFLVGDAWWGCRSLALEWVATGEAKEDEGKAFASASKIPGVAGQEVTAIVELGRARAHVMLERPDFQAAHAALLPVLLEEKVLSGETVECICAAAIATLPDFSAVDSPSDAEGAVAASAAQEGTGDAGLLEALPFDGVGRPPSDSEGLTGNPEGGRLA